MADLASVVDAQDVEDGLPLKSLRTVHKAQKIVDERRKEEEALAAECKEVAHIWVGTIP